LCIFLGQTTNLAVARLGVLGGDTGRHQTLEGVVVGSTALTRDGNAVGVCLGVAERTTGKLLGVGVLLSVVDGLAAREGVAVLGLDTVAANEDGELAGTLEERGLLADAGGDQVGGKLGKAALDGNSGSGTNTTVNTSSESAVDARSETKTETSVNTT